MILHVSLPVVLVQTPSAPIISCDLPPFLSAPGAPLQDVLDDTASR